MIKEVFIRLQPRLYNPHLMAECVQSWRGSALNYMLFQAWGFSYVLFTKISRWKQEHFSAMSIISRSKTWTLLITPPETLITVTADNVANIIQNNHSLHVWSLTQSRREASGRWNARVGIFRSSSSSRRLESRTENGERKRNARRLRVYFGVLQQLERKYNSLFSRPSQWLPSRLHCAGFALSRSKTVQMPTN